MKRTPVVIVTGFLGSGKTTFINWILEKKPDAKISLILNEFGDVKLESQFISQPSANVMELANGCMCCVAKSDIPRVINLILERSPDTQMILVEASGLSDPEPVRSSLESEALREKILVDSLVCVVDAVNFLKTKDEHPMVMSQAGDADIILISKVQEVSETEINNLQGFLESVFERANIVRMGKDLNPDIFFHQPNKANHKVSKETHKHEHEAYSEVWFKSDQEINILCLERVVRSLPSSVIRAKGFVYAGESKPKYLLQYVAGKYSLHTSDWGEDENKRTALLFLGQRLNEDEILRLIKECEG